MFMVGGLGGTATLFSTAPVANPTAFTWSAAVKTLASGAKTFMPCLNTDGTALLWGEYGDPVGGPSIYRSTDGTTWTQVLGPLATTRHIHCVVPDPYVPGDWYATAGDSTNPTRIYVSHDYGVTWTALPAAVASNSAYQAVQISFDPTYLYFAADTGAAALAYRLPRTDLTSSEWISPGHPSQVAVPGGTPARRVADLVTTAASATVTSATAAFTANDVGALLRTVGQNFLPADTFIVSVTNATTVVVSKAANKSGGALSAVISGEMFGIGTYYGKIDPITGIFYVATLNGGLGGNVGGLFAVFPDGQLVLVDVLNTMADAEMFIANGFLYAYGFSYPLLALR
jgi:hypothetical protein